MIEVLLPRTDAGVALQLLVVSTVAAVALIVVWRRAHWRVFVIGVWVLGLAGFGLRALH